VFTRETDVRFRGCFGQGDPGVRTPASTRTTHEIWANPGTSARGIGPQGRRGRRTNVGPPVVKTWRRPWSGPASGPTLCPRNPTCLTGQKVGKKCSHAKTVHWTCEQGILTVESLTLFFTYTYIHLFSYLVTGLFYSLFISYLSCLLSICLYA
jgi:hypothetical protein